MVPTRAVEVINAPNEKEASTAATEVDEEVVEVAAIIEILTEALVVVEAETALVANGSSVEALEAAEATITRTESTAMAATAGITTTTIIPPPAVNCPPQRPGRPHPRPARRAWPHLQSPPQ